MDTQLPLTQHDALAARMMRVVEHISANLDAPLDFNVLAEVACLSPYHFHRVYVAQTGETVAETLRRRRLYRAALQLSRTQEPISKIARQAGYQSVAAFSRAFSASYETPPAAWRRKRHQPAPDTLKPTEPIAMKNISVETLPALRAAVLNHTGPYTTLGTAFERLGPLAGVQGLYSEQSLMIALYLDDPAAVPAAQLRSQCGLTIADAALVKEPLQLVEIPAGRAACYRHIGPYSDLGPLWHRFYTQWLAPSGELPSISPCYELYRNDPRTAKPNDLITDLYIPLK